MNRAVLTAILLLPITASAATSSRAEYLMGTVCEITAERAGDAQLEAAFAEGRRVERLISTWKPDSELTRLNRSGESVLSPETYSLLRTAVALSRRTGGTFNPLMRPLIDSWKTRGQGALPTAGQIDAALHRAKLDNIELLDGNRVALRNGAEVEEGGFGKGYGIDRMLMRIPAGDVVINFGGQLFVRGASNVSIADPERRDVPVVSFRMRDASLSTSSGSEKTFEVNGRRFTHIVDPRSGQALPPRGSASVIAPDALTADALSTALYVMGPEEGLAWANRKGVAALFITPDHYILVSTPFRAAARDLVVDEKFELKD